MVRLQLFVGGLVALITAGVHAGSPEEDATCSRDVLGSCLAPTSASLLQPTITALPADARWSPKTISVVLPCAGEGVFAQRTIESVANSIPGGIGGPTLADIIVVDDGSSPPLTDGFLTADFQEKYPLTVVRHEAAIGLMGAKSAGAAAAKGDLIVFFDCHVAPQGSWYQDFLESSAENWRRIVVPLITNLDIDTWEEIPSHHGQQMSKCYLTWDAEFKWLQSDKPYMPVLSGGLLGISRRWWDETGGYDSGMSGWGGENIDQSLRTWLCGGEIVSLSDTHVAHMWRKPSDERTSPQYSFDFMSVYKNKGRAVLAWYDEFIEKAGEFSGLSMVGIGSKGSKEFEADMDVSNLHVVRDRLQCKPFAWFLWRFRDIYTNGGLLPAETVQLQEISSGLCLTVDGPQGVNPSGAGKAFLMPCGATGPEIHAASQRWHARNKKGHQCCSGIGNWNSDQCLHHVDAEGTVATVVCDVSGTQSPAWEMTKAVVTSVTADANAEPSLAAGQIYFGGLNECLVVDLSAPKVEFMAGHESPRLKLKKCKKDWKGAKPTWRFISPEVPMETELYTRALQERPELFKD